MIPGKDKLINDRFRLRRLLRYYLFFCCLFFLHLLQVNLIVFIL